MIVDTKTIVSISEANQNFSKVARMADEYGQVLILKNNSPKYLLIEFDSYRDEETISDAVLKAASKRLIKKNENIYEELAK